MTSNSEMPAARARRGRARPKPSKSDVRTDSLPVAQLGPEDGRVRQQRRGQSPVVGRADREGVRPVGHQAADGAEVAGRGEPAGVDDQHRVGEALDLLQDVRREQDGATGRGHAPQQLHHVQPLAWVHAVEGFVEQQHGGVVDQCAGQLGTLAHALGVGADGPVGGILELDRGDGPGRRRRRHPATPCRRALRSTNSRPVR